MTFDEWVKQEPANRISNRGEPISGMLVSVNQIHDCLGDMELPTGNAIKTVERDGKRYSVRLLNRHPLYVVRAD